MDAAEDDDVRLQRASAGLLLELRSLLPKVLWKLPLQGPNHPHVRRRMRARHLDRIIALIEPFQEEPQLLDSHLKQIVPPLVTAYLEYLQIKDKPKVTKGFFTPSNAICRVLYTLCKVRGEKIVVGFLSNEARYLEPILAAFEDGTASANTETDDTSPGAFTWEERYIILLWLSHLLLAPFDLASMSSDKPAHGVSKLGVKNLPSNLPGIGKRVLFICAGHLKSATRERDTAGTLLVRLILRPDSRRIGLLDSIIPWALSFFDASSYDLPDTHQSLGVLSFLSRLVASASRQEIGGFIPAIYITCHRIVGHSTLGRLKSSAVARKLIIKIFRNIVVLCLQYDNPVGAIDVATVLEEVVGYLLESLSDGDTPVRYAASKALSVITLKLESLMAGEVVEALLGFLNEDVLCEGSTRNLTAVNPLRWHGLTLTLAHLLYRRAPSTGHLPDILSALLLALQFEQRSATGGSIGTNVRDAACFGIWAISRRYTTKELLAIPILSIRAAQRPNESISIIQMLALELLTAACLDPAGNIRRGSSAALQELVGRHPDTVCEGISLVQIVDYHAVGLRNRAITEVGERAAHLDHLYWQHLFQGILGWRGVASPDTASRFASATAIGRLSCLQPFNVVRQMAEAITTRLKALEPREVEERHGLIISLACLLRACRDGEHMPSLGLPDRSTPCLRTKTNLAELKALWNFLLSDLRLTDKHFTSSFLRPELAAAAVCTLISKLSAITLHLRAVEGVEKDTAPDYAQVVSLINLCLRRTEDSVLRELPQTVKQFSLLLPATGRNDLAETWLAQLRYSGPHLSSRNSGHLIAIGAIYVTLGPNSTLRNDILDKLISRCSTKEGEIEARVVALRSLTYLFEAVRDNKPAQDAIAAALLTALDDYTINERGDIGSLMRLEAISALESALSSGLLRESENRIRLQAAVLRLSLEKLDKVRSRAARCLAVMHTCELSTTSDSGLTLDVSSYEYFARALKRLGAMTHQSLRSALLEGYASSAGLGSEPVLQAARSALVDYLDGLSVDTGVFSLLDVCSTAIDSLKTNLTTDRIVIPLLEVIALLFDAQVFQRLIGSSFKWRNLLSLVQKAHYKTNNVRKLHIALDVYRGLADVEIIRGDVLTKLSSMLLHPFPKIRIAAAETLFVVTGDADLKPHDWSRSAKELRPVAERIEQNAVGSKMQN